MSRHVWITTLVALSLVMVAAPLTASAQEERQNYAVGRWAYKRLSAAHKALSEDKLADAIEQLDDMKERDLNPHEKALMWQTYGYVYSTQEKLAEAATAFENCLAQDALPEAAALNTQYNLGQLYLASERPKDAVRVFADWMTKAKNPSPQAHHLTAVAYAQVKQQEPALRHIKEALARSNKKPEGWFLLQASLHLELKQVREVLKVLKELIRRYPKKGYWIQLSAAYTEIDDEERALAVMQLAYEQDLLDKASEHLSLAQRLIGAGVPIQATKVLKRALADGVLERDFKSLALLSDSYVQSRELLAAAEPMGAAAALAKDGEVYVRLAQLNLSLERWAEAAAAIDKAFAKGDLRDPGNAHLMMGMAHYSAKKKVAAAKAFREALRFDKTKKTAQQWLNLVRSAPPS